MQICINPLMTSLNPKGLVVDSVQVGGLVNREAKFLASKYLDFSHQMQICEDKLREEQRRKHSSLDEMSDQMAATKQHIRDLSRRDKQVTETPLPGNSY